MNIGVIIYSGDSETVWNAFRFANFALKKGDQVKLFLIGKGVESDSFDKEMFNITEQLKLFVDGGGKIFACGTCLRIHQYQPPEFYVVATLDDLYEMAKGSDKLVTF